MRTKEAILNGKKIDVVVELDDEYFEEIFLVENDEDINLENTRDLSKTMEIIIGEKNE